MNGLAVNSQRVDTQHEETLAALRSVGKTRWWASSTFLNQWRVSSLESDGSEEKK